MSERVLPTETVAEAYLALLKARGIDYLFGNAGTDFAPIIEAYARGEPAGLEMPQPIVCPHETAAVAMAHGYWLATGKPQAVMVHVNVGMANAVMGIINAARDNVPILFTSGRTPLTETGHLGSRDLGIHWGQEMFDQAALVRESCKWSYELRYGDALETVIDRALAIAMTPPRGPVYLALPREVIAEKLERFSFSATPRLLPAGPAHPDPAAIQAAAAILARAERPLVIAAREEAGARSSAHVAQFLERFAIPLVEWWPTAQSLPSAHPLHAGHDLQPWLGEADAIIVLDALVPWFPHTQRVAREVPVIGIGPDPLFASVPIRGHAVDVPIAGDSAVALAALGEALTAKLAGKKGALKKRREALAARIAAGWNERIAAAERGASVPMSLAYLSVCLDRARDRDAIVVSELGANPGVMRFANPAVYFRHPIAGGLGWGVPAALGVKLACPDRLVIATPGDGSHIFANPVACHQIAAALDLPILIVVANNGVWNAVRMSTRLVYPQGRAVRMNRMPFSSLEPSPAYEKICAASGGYGEAVEDPASLPAAFERAIRAVKVERRQALLNVRCQ